MFILAPSPPHPPPPFFTRRQANLSVGEFKISHIISYLGKIQDGGEIVYKCGGAEKNPCIQYLYLFS